MKDLSRRARSRSLLLLFLASFSWIACDATCVIPSPPNQYTLVAPPEGIVVGNQTTVIVWCVDDADMFSYFDDCTTEYEMKCELDADGNERAPTLQDRMRSCQFGYLKPGYQFYGMRIAQIPQNVFGGEVFYPIVRAEIYEFTTGNVMNDLNCVDAYAMIETSTIDFPTMKQTELQRITIAGNMSANTFDRGTFRISLTVDNYHMISDPLHFNSSWRDVQTAIESFEKIQIVNIIERRYNISSENSFGDPSLTAYKEWDVEFLTAVGNIPSMHTLTSDDGCADCDEGDVLVSVATLRNGTFRPHATIINGTADFHGVAIHEAGNYTLFTWSPALEVLIVSDTLVVEVGAPTMLNIVERPMQVTEAGVAFHPQPKLTVSDMGGNIIATMNDVEVSAYLATNPAGGTLGPAPNLVQSVVNGVIQFSGLGIDVASSGYVVRFETQLNITKPSVDLHDFVIGLGPAHHIHVESEPSSAVQIFGGRTMDVQPVVSLRDVAGNVRIFDSSSYVRCELDAIEKGATLRVAEIQTVVLEHGIETPTTTGEWRLRYTDGATGATFDTETLSYNATADAVEAALEALDAVGNVDVIRRTTNVSYTSDYGIEVDEIAAIENAVRCSEGHVKLSGYPVGRPYMFTDGAWAPICGHYFWENNVGCSLVCQELGYDGGATTREAQTYAMSALEVGRCVDGDRVAACSGQFNFYSKTRHCAAGQPVSVVCGCTGNNGGIENECASNYDREELEFYETSRTAWEITFVTELGNVPTLEPLTENVGAVIFQERRVGNATVGEMQTVRCRAVSGHVSLTLPVQAQSFSEGDVNWFPLETRHAPSGTFGPVHLSVPGASGLISATATASEVMLALTEVVGPTSLVESVHFSEGKTRFCDSAGSNEVTIAFKPVVDLVASYDVPSFALSPLESSLVSPASPLGNVTVIEGVRGSSNSIEIQYVQCAAVAGEVVLSVPAQSRSDDGSYVGAVHAVLTSPIPFDATSATLASILTDDENSLVASSFFSRGMTSFCDPTGSNRVAIIFQRPEDLVESHDIPTIIADDSDLSGGSVDVSTMTNGTAAQSEVQRLLCVASGGNVVLTIPTQFFSGSTFGPVLLEAVTAPISFDATESTLLDAVTVHLLPAYVSLVSGVQYSHGSSLCTTDGSNEVTITFEIVNDPVSAGDEDLDLIAVDDGSNLFKASNEVSFEEVTRGDGVDAEVQEIVCVASSGALTLVVPTQNQLNRTQPGALLALASTEPIPHDADSATLLQMLTHELRAGCPLRRDCGIETLTFPLRVPDNSSLVDSITYSSGTSLCTSDGSNTVTVTFKQVLDPVTNAALLDLPILAAHESTLLLRGAESSLCSECAPIDGLMDTVLTGKNIFRVDQITQGCLDEALCVDEETGLPRYVVQQVKNGVASFRGLNVDRFGKRYRLRFSVVEHMPSSGWIVIDDRIEGLSQTFDVDIGPLERVRVIAPPGGIWSGGVLQPFKTQPSVVLVDAGDNAHAGDYESWVTVSLANESSAYLGGTRRVRAVAGFVNFTDLSIEGVGLLPFELVFRHEASNLSSSISLSAKPSVEYMWTPSRGLPGDRIGESVAIGGSTALVGAPATDRPTVEVQRVHTVGSSSAFVREVQRLVTSATHRDVVQRIRIRCGHSTNNSSTSCALSGHMRVRWAGRPLSRPVPLEGLVAQTIQVFLSEDIPGLANRDRSIRVERAFGSSESGDVAFDVTFVSSNHSYAGCYTSLDPAANGTAPPGTPCAFPFVFNNRTYRYCTSDTHRSGTPWCSTDPTYRGMWGDCQCTLSNDVPLLEIDATEIVPTDANVTVDVLVPATEIGGEVAITVASRPNSTFENASNDAVYVPWNASEIDLRDALRSLSSRDYNDVPVPLAVENVERSEASTAEGGYTWTVTFAASETAYDVPSLVVVDDATSLTGHQALASFTTLRDGAAPIGSSFALYFGGEGPTESLAFNATSEDVRRALETLETVGEVNVTREVSDEHVRSYVWTVSFLSTYTFRRYGYTVDGMYNLPAIVADASLLSGTDAQIRVETLRVREDYMELGRTAMGSPGFSTGAVYVLEMSPENGEDDRAWTESARLLPDDADTGDMFGASVSTDGQGLAIVGAPGAQAIVGMQQRDLYNLRCSAENGTFVLKFDGSDDRISIGIDHDAASVAAAFRAVDIVIDASVSPSDFDSLCAVPPEFPSTRLIAVVLRQNASLELEFSDLQASNELGGFVRIERTEASTLDIESSSHRAQQIGASYVFSRTSDGSNRWTQVSKLVPAIAGLAIEPHELGAMGFGTSVVIRSDLDNNRWAFVSAPFQERSRGAVYVFRALNESRDVWSQVQHIDMHGTRLPGDMFGSTLAAAIDASGTATLAVAVPGLNSPDTAGMCVDLPGWQDHHGRTCAWYEEHDVCTSNADVVDACCACGYEGFHGNATGLGYGGVAIFTKHSSRSLFYQDQLLIPDHALSARFQNGGFGHSISLDRNTLVVGAPFESSAVRVTVPVVGTRDQEEKAVGAVYVYRRTSSNAPFQFAQRLVHSDFRAMDRFGIGVAISGHVLLVAQRQQRTDRTNTPRFSVQQIQTTANFGTTIDGSFVLLYRKKVFRRDGVGPIRCYPGTEVPCHASERDFLCVPCPGEFLQSGTTSLVRSFATARLSHNISAIDLRVHLLEILDTHRVLVQRTPTPDAQGGHTWTVTMTADPDNDPLDERFLEAPLTAISYLSGEGAEIAVSLERTVRESPNRKSVYAFTRIGGQSADFIEQAALEPYYEQRTDDFATSVEISGTRAIVGAPNRDTFISEENNGAAFLYTTEFLDVSFAEDSMEVDEDVGLANVEIRRCNPHCLSSAVQCEDRGGLPLHGVCWYLGDEGSSCIETCASKGAAGVLEPSNTYYSQSVLPQLIDRTNVLNLPAVGPYECLSERGVMGSSFDVLAIHLADLASLPAYQHDTWSSSNCSLACPCAFPDALSNVPIRQEASSNDASYVRETMTWTEADQACRSEHRRLCEATDLCRWMNGTGPTSAFTGSALRGAAEESRGVWIPVDEGTGSWMCASSDGCDGSDADETFNASICTLSDDSGLGQREAINMSDHSAILVCCGPMYPPPPSSRSALSVQYATGDIATKSAHIDTAALRRPSSIVLDGSGTGRDECEIPTSIFVEANSSNASLSLSSDAQLVLGHCRWLAEEVENFDARARYDWQAHNDYAPVGSLITFEDGERVRTFSVAVNDDDVVEVPNEHVHVRLHLPGYRSSFSGRGWSVITIANDGDGVVGLRSYSAIFHASNLPGASSGKNVLVAPPGSADDRASRMSRIDDAFGYSTAVSGDYAFVGSPGYADGSGAVYVSRKRFGEWEDVETLVLPSVNDANQAARFGASLSTHGRSLLVGAPGAAIAFLFLRDQGESTYDLVAELRQPNSFYSSPNHRFGARGSVAIWGRYAVVGASGIDRVFTFHQMDVANESSWTYHQTLRPSGFVADDDAQDYGGKIQFGCSVAIEASTVVVGAQRATPSVTNATSFYFRSYESITYGGSGAVFVFEKNASSVAETTNGTYTTNGTSLLFELHSVLWPSSSEGRNATRKGGSLFGSAVAIDKDTLVVGAVGESSDPACSWDFESGSLDGWTRTGTAFNNQPVYGDNSLYREVYAGHLHGPDGKVYDRNRVYDPVQIAGVHSPYNQVHAFEHFVGYEPATNQTMTSDSIVTTIELSNTSFVACRDACFYRSSCLGFSRPHPSDVREYAQCVHIDDGAWTNTTLPPADVRVKLVLSQEQQTYLKVGRFEGFYQSRLDHAKYASSHSTGPRGHFYVGTYEHRPSANDPTGAIQGDAPVGTMRSPPFLIRRPQLRDRKNDRSGVVANRERGARISFLVGGGCLAHDVRVELIVDGRGTVRTATGECIESMRRVVWDVDAYVDTAAIIRVVDNSNGDWGHINFDDVRFSWREDTEGASGATASRTPVADALRAGGAYVFKRHEPGNPILPCSCACAVTDTFCECSKHACSWIQESLLAASDKRPGALFGSSVTVSNDVIAVGSTRGASDGGAVYVYRRPSSDVIGEYASWSQHGAHHVTSQSNLDEFAYTNATELWNDPIGRSNFDSHSVATEYAKLTVPHATLGAQFGASLALEGYTLVAGAPEASLLPWNDGSGAAYVRDIEVATTVIVSSALYAASESSGSVVVRLFRAAPNLISQQTESLHVAYSTSDQTARGITSRQWIRCSGLRIEDRGVQCGDYVMSHGIATFEPGMEYVDITITIVDDKCREDRSETFLLELSIVGSNAPIRSVHHEAVVRIDDDDVGLVYCQGKFTRRE